MILLLIIIDLFPFQRTFCPWSMQVLGTSWPMVNGAMQVIWQQNSFLKRNVAGVVSCAGNWTENIVGQDFPSTNPGQQDLISGERQCANHFCHPCFHDRLWHDKDHDIISSQDKHNQIISSSVLVPACNSSSTQIRDFIRKIFSTKISYLCSDQMRTPCKQLEHCPRTHIHIIGRYSHEWSNFGLFY